MSGYLIANILINAIAIIAFIIDFITYPVWCIIQRPWGKTGLMEKKFAEKISFNGTEVTYRSTEKEHPHCKEALQKGVDTMEKMLNLLREKYATRPCIATRQILGVDTETSPETGKVWKKYNMADYQWMTYDQMFQRALAFGKGVKELGYPPRTKVVMYADTRGDYAFYIWVSKFFYQ